MLKMLFLKILNGVNNYWFVVFVRYLINWLRIKENKMFFYLKDMILGFSKCKLWVYV